MFLLHINKYKLKKENLLKISYYKHLINKTKNKINLLQKIKEYNIIKNLYKIILYKKIHTNSFNYKLKTFVNYIIGISLSKTNSIIYLTDIKGKVKYFNTSGLLKLTKKQKRNKVVIIFKLLKELISTNKFLNKDVNIALHFKNLNERTCCLITSFLFKHFQEIKTIKITNNQAHNGCRPKKIKRKKNRRIIFLKK